MRTCFDVVFLFENIRTCLFTRVFMYFLHLVLTFTPHYIIMVKGLLSLVSCSPGTSSWSFITVAAMVP